MSRFTWIIDNGHGGVLNGIPQTAGKRSPDFGKGILYEGVSNRRLADQLTRKLKKANIDFVLLVPEVEDIGLSERVKRVNSLENGVLISIHSDAFTNPVANGWSTYTTKGKTKSDKLATYLYYEAENEFGRGKHIRKDNTDGDPDKEANFYILRKTKYPAVLVENFFMTNRDDYDLLMSELGQERIVNVMFKAILTAERDGL